MSTAPLAHNADLARLLDDGYDVVVQQGHLIVRHIPYVTTGRTIAYGFLTYPVTVSGDTVVSGTDHRIWLGASTPCDEHGVPLTIAQPEVHQMTATEVANFMLSSKPAPDGYPDEYSKITTYVRIVAQHAQALDPTATATPGAAWQEVEDDSVFHYRDTASSRAGLAALNARYRGQRVVVVGLGGTGSFIADQMAKIEIDALTLVDGDSFDNHNAFRAPGAPDLVTLRTRPNKAKYFADIYSRMHRHVSAVPEFLDVDNVDRILEGATFVFLASDDASSKKPVVDWLEHHEVAFIDVGMGIEEVDGHLTGLLRVTTSVPGHRDHVRDRRLIPSTAPGLDDYGRNIQTSDLNCLNGMLAVIRFKRYLGYYADLTDEGFSTYALSTNEIANEERR
ncbi:hypothetical protein A2J03_22600 [Rhodococcus sp. EPR-157]|uniref:ThiF family adenylyltransferase n=1 Tax=Rhodococcus sp. EPR-157 TaxID=1813677 RepID=UPI0007BC2E0D|nr:ThiF family adenylyltransferase [Rhodococcus sp. EPR-157]KZF07839.1 hypothetical protein A2J03_22600 [Rhodococcus sp. EPR-157]